MDLNVIISCYNFHSGLDYILLAISFFPVGLKIYCVLL